MDEIFKLLITPLWWFQFVFVGLVMSVASKHITKATEPLAQHAQRRLSAHVLDIWHQLRSVQRTNFTGPRTWHLGKRFFWLCVTSMTIVTHGAIALLSAGFLMQVETTTQFIGEHSQYGSTWFWRLYVLAALPLFITGSMYIMWAFIVAPQKYGIIEPNDELSETTVALACFNITSGICVLIFIGGYTIEHLLR